MAPGKSQQPLTVIECVSSAVVAGPLEVLAVNGTLGVHVYSESVTFISTQQSMTTLVGRSPYIPM